MGFSLRHDFSKGETCYGRSSLREISKSSCANAVYHPKGGQDLGCQPVGLCCSLSAVSPAGVIVPNRPSVSPLGPAEIVLSSLSKMKTAGMLLGFAVEPVPATTNVDGGFQIMPVGAAGVGFGGFFGLTVLQSVGSTMLPGNGILTCKGAIVPSPS